MKKINNKKNAFGELIKYHRNKLKLSRADVSRELDLINIPISPDELYRMETHNLSIKDFELVALCSILNINFNDLNSFLKDTQNRVES